VAMFSIRSRDYAALLKDERLRFGLLFLFIAILFILRRPDAITNPQFWAEDAVLIFRDQFLQGGLTPIFEPYKGYFIVNTRLVGAFASLFPLLWEPLIYNLAAICIAALACSMFSLRCYRGLMASDNLRRACCIVAACALYTESLVDNLANTQWYLALIGLLVLIRPASCDKQSSWWRVSILMLLSGLATLTNPALVVTVPFALWAAVFRQGKTRAVPLVTLAGCGVQLVCFFNSSSAAVTNRLQVDQLLAALVISNTYKVLISSLLGVRAAISASVNDLGGFILAAIVVGAAWLVWLWLHLGWSKRRQMAIALYLSVGFVLAALQGRDLSPLFATVTGLPDQREEQYFFLSSCLLVFLVALTVEETLKGPFAKFQPLALLALFSAGLMVNFRVPPLIDMHWPEEAREIADWRADRIKGNFATIVSASINPPGWILHFSPPPFRKAVLTGGAGDTRLRIEDASGWSSSVSVGAWRSAPDGSYLLLPAIFGDKARYLVRADVCSVGTERETISLYVHGKMSQSALSGSPPETIASGCVWIGTEFTTDALESMCVHLREHPNTSENVKKLIIERR